MNRLLAVLLVPLVLLLAACGGDDAKPAPTATPDDGRTPLTFAARSGKQPVLRAELALTPAQLNTGLSKRESLPQDAGMLFLIPFRGPGFWMKDTLIPLSVAFIAPCGDIVGIADMQPLTDQLHNVEAEYRFGLEVNQGWFARNGIAVGDKLNVPDGLKQPGCP